MLRMSFETSLPMCSPATCENTALYVHIPFCRSICAYCDFARAGYHPVLAERYLDQLQRELNDRVPADAPIRTVYIGGGTPTALNAGQLRRLLKMLERWTDKAREVTIETNPEVVSEELIACLQQGHVNRVSLGVQSADDGMLKRLGRRHTWDQAVRAVDLLQRQGLTNLSCDLMYSLPGQSRMMWQKTLRQAVSLQVPHLSLYSLTIEEHSAFGRSGQQPLDDQTESEMYFEAVDFLRAQGYQHYEISNFARPGRQSQHNLQYWKYHDFYGVGLGASGKLGNFRYDNTRNFQQYLAGQWVAERIDLSETDRQFEMLMMNLRLAEGLDLRRYDQCFSIPFEQRYAAALQRCLNSGWLTLHDSILRPTEQGMALLNSVLEEFMD